jgi:hypothetical protein
MEFQDPITDPGIEDAAGAFLEEHEVFPERQDIGLPSFDPSSQDRYEIDLDQLAGGDGIWDFDPTDEELGEMERGMQGDGLSDDDAPLNHPGIGPGRSLIWDVCAWYQAFHFYGPTDWGIYIKQDCVLRAPKEFIRYVPKHLRGTYDPRGWFNRFAAAAMFAYYLHEHYHHCVESLGFRLQVVLGRSCYVPYKLNVYRVLKAAAGGGALPPQWNPDDQIEEALANANSYRRLSESTYKDRVSPLAMKAVKKCLKRQFRYEPPGYKQAYDYLSNSDFREGQNVLQALVLDGTMVPKGLSSLNHGPWRLAPGMMRGMFNIKRRFWGVVDKGGKRRFPKI